MPKPTLAPLVKKWAGKQPDQVKLLNNPELRSRLKKLMHGGLEGMTEI